jgi:hypothetical protein
MRLRRAAWHVAGLVLLGGCAAPRGLYFWGGYEDLVYQAWREPGSVPIERQVELLQRDYQQGQALHLRMPPGWHAHLGVLYYGLGKPDEALRELQVEKAEFPESGTFVDRLVANMKSSR